MSHTTQSLGSELGRRLVVDHPVDNGSHSLQGNLNLITILQPQGRSAAHTHTLGSIQVS